MITFPLEENDGHDMKFFVMMMVMYLGDEYNVPCSL